MANPVEGQDYLVSITLDSTYDVSNSVVTFEYKKPDNVIVTNLTPTEADGNTFSYKLPNDITTEGDWHLILKIVDENEDVTYTNPSVIVHFDKKLK